VVRTISSVSHVPGVIDLRLSTVLRDAETLCADHEEWVNNLIVRGSCSVINIWVYPAPRKPDLWLHDRTLANRSKPNAATNYVLSAADSDVFSLLSYVITSVRIEWNNLCVYF
jgi:hypothetical protein